MKKNIEIEYIKFMSNDFREWLADGLNQWLVKWKDLMVRSKKYKLIHINWMINVSAVWQKVPDLNSYFKTLEKERSKDLTTEASRSAFAAVSPSYFGIDASEFTENEPEDAENHAVTFAKSEKPRSRPRNKRANPTKHGEDVRKRFKNRYNYFCKNCDNNHKIKNCFLALDKNKSWIIEKQRKIFENNMKNSAFHKHVESLRHFKQ